jgi:putative addiction module component (TIGR02574 family)
MEMAMTTVDALFAQAEALPPGEFELLVLRLNDRLHEFATPEIEAAWNEEIERRITASDRGDIRAIPWEEARKSLGL